MARDVETCILTSFLGATWTKPEEQATAVLGSALATSRAFRASLLDRLGITASGQVKVNTEVQTGRARDRIDLQLEVANQRGGLTARAWIEVKVTAALMAAVKYGDDVREPQLKRYRAALDERDQARPDLEGSALALLVPNVEPEDRRQSEETKATILLWQEVGDLAAACARSIGGEQWRAQAREAEATLELANLETLLWFLEAANRPGSDKARRNFVGIDSVPEPVSVDIAAHYGHSHEALMTIGGLLERASEILEAAGWNLHAVGEESDDDVFGSEDDVTSTLSEEEKELFERLMVDWEISSAAEPWWAGSDNSAWFQACPFDDQLRPRSAEPVMQVGVSFGGAGGPFPSPAWLEQLDLSGFQTVEHPATGAIAGIWKTKPLGSFIEGASPAEQAQRVAKWVEEGLAALNAASPQAVARADAGQN